MSVYCRDPEREMDVLLDEDHACPGLVRDTAHDRQQPLDNDGCQTETHLVDHQHFRVADQRPRHSEHLLFATREQASATMLQRGKSRQQVERPVHPCASVGA